MPTPVRLNLLSPEKRRSIERLVYAQFARNAVEVIVCIFSLLGIALLGGDWVLQTHLDDLSVKLTHVSHQEAEKSSQIRAINKTLIQTDMLLKRYRAWPAIVRPIVEAIPSGITLEHFSIDKDRKNLTLIGTAATRDTLILLEQNLKTVQTVQSVSLPFSQLTTRENLRFSISITLQ